MGNTVLEVQPAGEEHVTLRVGDRLELHLPETPTTGYRWQADAGPLLRLVDDTFEGATQPRGSAGTRVLTFEATGAGSVELHLENRRAWGDSPPAATARVGITVEG